MGKVNVEVLVYVLLCKMRKGEDLLVFYIWCWLLEDNFFSFYVVLCCLYFDWRLTNVQSVALVQEHISLCPNFRPSFFASFSITCYCYIIVNFKMFECSLKFNFTVKKPILNVYDLNCKFSLFYDIPSLHYIVFLTKLFFFASTPL